MPIQEFASPLPFVRAEPRPAAPEAGIGPLRLKSVVLWMLVGASFLAAGWWWLSAHPLAATIRSRRVIEIPDLRISMVPIPAGTLVCNGRPPDAARAAVAIEAFYLGRTEVTRLQYAAYGMRRFTADQDLRCPVDNVTWHEAMGYCTWLTKRERAAGRLPKGWSYTLPTEAQWEYACRAEQAGSGLGVVSLAESAWLDCNSGGESHPVATKRPNAWGLSDMLGNVAEWCLDLVPSESAGVVSLDLGRTDSRPASFRANRGGSWNTASRDCDATRQGSNGECSPFVGLGFRVALVRRVDAESPEGLRSVPAGSGSAKRVEPPSLAACRR